eukprot:365273-Chlamydomonas_euryale.AAC.3
MSFPEPGSAPPDRNSHWRPSALSVISSGSTPRSHGSNSYAAQLPHRRALTPDIRRARPIPSGSPHSSRQIVPVAAHVRPAP